MIEREMNYGIIIARAKLEDVEAILTLHSEMYVSTYIGVTPELTKEALRFHIENPIIQQRRRINLQDCIQDIELAAVFVAREGNKIVGYRRTRITEDGKHWNTGSYVSRQKEGIGPALFKKSLEWHGLENDIYLNVVPNTPAVDFHKKRGFLPTGKHQTDILAGGQSPPLIEMKLSAKKI